MTGALETIGASTKALGVLKDVPLWLLTAVAAFLLVFPFLSGTADLLSRPTLSWIRIAGILFAILAVCRLGNVLAPLTRAWWGRREERRTLHLTLNDQQSFWASTRQQDGSVTTQFIMRFMAKNRTNAPLHLLKARIIRPKMRGDVFHSWVLVRALRENLYGTAQVTGNHIPPNGLLPISVDIIIRGAPRKPAKKLGMLIGVTDESGNETRVHLDLKRAG